MFPPGGENFTARDYRSWDDSQRFRLVVAGAGLKIFGCFGDRSIKEWWISEYTIACEIRGCL